MLHGSASPLNSGTEGFSFRSQRCYTESISQFISLDVFPMVSREYGIPRASEQARLEGVSVQCLGLLDNRQACQCRFAVTAHVQGMLLSSQEELKRKNDEVEKLVNEVQGHVQGKVDSKQRQKEEKNRQREESLNKAGV